MCVDLPGMELEPKDGERVFSEFLANFRDDSPLKKIPTHCDFKGAVGEIFWGSIFDEVFISDEEPVYYIRETGTMQRWPQEVRSAAMGDVRNYLKRREAWESYDTYILDLAMTWCIVITHDDIVYHADPNGCTEE